MANLKADTGAPVQVLDHGFVRLKEVLGNDLTVVNAARVSFGKEKEVFDESDEGLLNFLIRENHTSPLEHGVMQFHIKCPIFVAREWQRHRWASYNEMSMRYHKPEQLDFYIAKDEDIRTQVGKPGSYAFEPIEDEYVLTMYSSISEDVNKYLTEIYEYFTENLGIAKELARAVLPVGMYTEFWFTANLHSLFHFLRLRDDTQALREFQYYAKVIASMVKENYPKVYEAYEKHYKFAI